MMRRCPYTEDSCHRDDCATVGCAAEAREGQVARLQEVLQQIRLRADSQAPAEELEDAQSDLRYIHTIATAALKSPPREGGGNG